MAPKLEWFLKFRVYGKYQLVRIRSTDQKRTNSIIEVITLKMGSELPYKQEDTSCTLHTMHEM